MPLKIALKASTLDGIGAEQVYENGHFLCGPEQTRGPSTA